MGRKENKAEHHHRMGGSLHCFNETLIIRDRNVASERLGIYLHPDFHNFSFSTIWPTRGGPANWQNHRTNLVGTGIWWWLKRFRRWWRRLWSKVCYWKVFLISIKKFFSSKMKKVRRLSMEIGQKVIRSLENSTPTPQTQDSQPFSPSDSQSSQTSTVPSTVPPVGREEEIQAESDETPAETADTADTVTKIERVSPSPLWVPFSTRISQLSFPFSTRISQFTQFSWDFRARHGSGSSQRYERDWTDEWTRYERSYFFNIV